MTSAASTGRWPPALLPFPAVVNPTSLMRLPGCFNRPSRAKRAKNRIDELVGVEFFDDAKPLDLQVWLKPEEPPHNKQEKPRQEAPHGAGAQSSEGDFFRRVKDASLANLGSWVPKFFPGAKFQSSTGAWRVSSKGLGRALEEDLSISPLGIVDFGVHDMGDSTLAGARPSIW